MNKAQALHDFWSSFGWTAYDQYSVPDNAEYPRITYEVATDSVGQVVPLTANLWTRDSSWEAISLKADEIAEYIGYGHKVVKIDGGYMWVSKGGVFAQRMNDPNDDMVRRVYVSISVEFLTAF